VGLAEDGLREEFRDYGRIANTPSALPRLVRKLDHEGTKLRFCYEARPVRLRDPTPVVREWARQCRCCAFPDSKTAGRLDQD
jgi:hypothetical protein